MSMENCINCKWYMAKSPRINGNTVPACDYPRPVWLKSWQPEHIRDAEQAGECECYDPKRKITWFGRFMDKILKR